MSQEDLETTQLDEQGSLDDPNTLPKHAHYVYEALDGNCLQIRLIWLRMASDSEAPIECSMITQDLATATSRNTIPYEAVSYLWGDPNLCETITVDGQPLLVTKNAFEMLRSLRGGPSGWLWIDAICINQHDITERNHQVQQMSKIYSSASRVVIYLGCPTAETDFLMSAMGTIELQEREERTTRHWGRGGIHKAEWTALQAKLSREVLDVEKRQRTAMYDLLGRSYFDRVWIIQEISLPSDGLVYCGNRRVSCETFVRTTKFLDVHLSAHRGELLNAMPTSLRRLNALNDRQDLFTLLSKYGEAKAFDQRDRIYGLLGLVRRGNDEPLVVDYAQNEADLVRRATAHICRCSVECLEAGGTAPTVASFIENLPTLYQSVLCQLVRSTHVRAPFDVMGLLQDPYLDYDITAAMIRDAEANHVHGNTLSTWLSGFISGTEIAGVWRRMTLAERMLLDVRRLPEV